MSLPPTLVSGFHNESQVRQMEYNQLGATDMVVSKLGFGAAPIGDCYGTYSGDPVKLIHDALRAGVNYIDTAYWYGQGKSEAILGKALSSVPRTAYYIATKVGLYEPPPGKMLDFSAEKVLQSVEDSLSRLGLPFVDVIQVHEFEWARDNKKILEETLPALEKVRAAGKARYIGITAYPLKDFLPILDQSKVHIDTVLTYSRSTLFDNSLKHYIPIFQKRNVGIINGAATGMGLLTPNGPPDWHPANTHLRQLCAAANEYCKDRGVNIAKLANYHGLSFPGVHTTLCGAQSNQILTSNLEAANGDITDAEKACLKDIQTKFFEQDGDLNFEEEYATLPGEFTTF